MEEIRKCDRERNLEKNRFPQNAFSTKFMGKKQAAVVAEYFDYFLAISFS